MKTKASSASTSVEQQLADLQRELQETRQQLYLGGATNVRRPRALRKQIARLLTKQRQVANQKEGK